MQKDINRNLVETKPHEDDVSVYAYDKSLVEDLRARFIKTDNQTSQVNQTVQIGSPSQMFDILGTMNEDTVIMPFISLERTGWNLNLDRQGYQTFIGERVYERIGPDNIPIEVRAQVIPITIHWRLSVWTTDRVTNDALVREILFYYHLRPSLMVYVGHGLNIAHKFNIYFNSDIEDNSDIANHDTNGQYYRQDLTLYSDDTYLWRSRYDEKVAVSTNLYFSSKPLR